MDKNSKKSYDGVEYTPGSAAKELERKQAQARAKRRAGQTTAPAKRPVKKANYGIFFALTMFTGVMVCIIVGLIVFNSMFKNNKPKTPSTNNQVAGVATPKPDETPIIFTDTESFTAMVTDILPDSKLSFLNLESGEKTILAVDSKSSLKSKYGDTIIFSQISPGDIVDIKYSGGMVRDLSYSSHVVEYRDISDVKIDTVDQKMTIGNSQLSYNNNIYLAGGLTLSDLINIKPTDVVNIRYLDNTVWYLGLSKSHGYIEFVNKEHVENGVIEIGNSIMMPIEESGTVEVLEGTYRVVVKGNNVEPISEEVTIARGETVTIDLQDMNLKKGFLILQMRQPDCIVSVDGVEIPTNEPQQFEYGQHTISVLKQGFLPWEDTFEINSASKELVIELTEEIKYCKLTINTDPSGAEIYIDNGYIGLAPLTVNVEYGTHTLLYRKDGYRTISTPITLDTEELTYNFVLLEELPLMP